MAFGQKLIPNKVNLDKAALYITPDEARFIKNLTPYVGANDAVDGRTEGENSLNLHSLQSNELYTNVSLPAGDNFVIGAKGFAQVNRAYVFVWNSLGNHCIYRINGNTRTSEIVKIDPCFNFKLNPEFFIGECQLQLEVNTYVNPDTGAEEVKEDLYWTDGTNYQGYLRADDCIQTNGFNENLFPYFAGNYDRCTLVRMGFPTPKDCVTFSEVPYTDADAGLNNSLLFKCWQFRVTYIDVFGRPSEHGIISDLYIPGINDCISSSNNLPRCLDLSIFSGNPLVDKIQIEYCVDNELQWKLDTVIDLYAGSIFGEWWKRVRNTDVQYDYVTNRITYRFCANKECTIIPTNETNKLQPGLPKISQALIRLGKYIALGNNKDGFKPFSQELKNQFSLTVTPPEPTVNDLADITVWICTNNGRGVARTGNQYYFGARQNDDSFYAEAQLQLFPEGQRSWIGYLNDGSYVVGEQYFYNPVTGEYEEDINYNYGGKVGLPKTGSSFATFVLQKFSFPKKQRGNYIFRLAGHRTDVLTTPDFQQTSTTVYGLCPFNLNTYQPYVNRDIYKSFEVDINICDNDYDTLVDGRILVVQDFAFFNSDNRPINTQGYVSEDANKTIPVELMSVISAAGGGWNSSRQTDHNGFYWASSAGFSPDFIFQFRNKCANGSFSKRLNTSPGTMTIMDFVISQQAGYLDFDTVACNRQIIKGRILIQGTDIGIPGISVMLQHTTPVVTDTNGYFSLIAHDEYGQETRDDKIYILGTCGYTGVNGECIQPVNALFSVCTFCDVNNPVNGERLLTLPDILLNFTVQQGLLSGGTYGWGFSGYDWLGRKTYQQVMGYFTVPSIIQSRTIGASTVSININPNATFPSDIEYIVPSITAETTLEDYLDWIVDSLEYIDNTGGTVSTPNLATQIKIYYRSIIEYNKQNNFNTTTAWQFIPESQTSPFVGDKIQFFINGDGQFFNKSIISLVKYAQDGTYILIDYTSDLSDLQPNAYIRLMRPKTCAGDEAFYEICQPIEIASNKAQINSFVLNAFDTYYLSREIPVPTLVPPTPPATEPTFVNELRILGFKFEHHSPSNFWGYKVWNRGRVNFKNPYESEILRPNQIAVSGAVSINGQLNFLQTFDEDKKVDLNVNNTSGIYGMVYYIGKVLIITQYDCFLVGYDDNLTRVNDAGQLETASLPERFGKPVRVSAGVYGCQAKDKSTIRLRNGIVSFIDRNSGEILRYADQIQSYTKDKCDAWFREKCRAVSADPNRYFVTGIDPITGELIVSDFSLTDKKYDNQLRTYDAQSNETVSFDMITRDLRMWTSFIGENYAFLDGDILNNNLFSFKSGQPYNHYNQSQNKSYNNFFGIQGGRVLEPVFNGFDGSGANLKKKKFLSLAMYCVQSLFFSDRITTDSKQLSYLFLTDFEWAEFFSFASFQCDVNTPTDPALPQSQNDNKLLEGNNLYGQNITFRLIGDPAADSNYCEITGVTIDGFISEKTG